jgi:hypothetical protein
VNDLRPGQKMAIEAMVSRAVLAAGL